MNDNELLESFFQNAREQQIDDDGFTERVMQCLPDSTVQHSKLQKLSWLWTAFCILLAVLLFLKFIGWQTALADLVVFIRTLPVDYRPTTILLSLLVLSWMGVAEVARRARLYQ
ncbi:MAG: DUF5056 domain-containing protein [Prevotella sp.]|nr:DUF5056 domain-containing protein [Prevotella sp.]